MIELNPESACSIILKLREFHAKEEVAFPEEPFGPSDDWALQVLVDHQDDLTFQELKNMIDDLEPDQQNTLVALMWLGRGDFDLKEWKQAVEQAKSSWNERTAEYIIATPLGADYIEEGLVQHGYSCDT